MPELSEIVFEKVPEVKLSKLVETLLSPHISTATYNGDDILNSFGTGLVRNHISSMQDGDAIFLNMHKINSAGLEIPKCSAQIMKHEGRLDLILIFGVEGLVKPSGVFLSLILRDFAQEIAQAYDVGNFYGGLEPAYDKETQYFSGSNLGPLAEIT